MTDTLPDPEAKRLMRVAADAAAMAAQAGLSPPGQCTAFVMALSSALAGFPGDAEAFAAFRERILAHIVSTTDILRAAPIPPLPTSMPPAETGHYFAATLDGPPGPGEGIRSFEFETGDLPWPISTAEMVRVTEVLPEVGRLLHGARPEMVVITAAIALAVFYKTNSHRYGSEPQDFGGWVQRMLDTAGAAPISPPQGLH